MKFDFRCKFFSKISLIAYADKSWTSLTKLAKLFYS